MNGDIRKMIESIWKELKKLKLRFEEGKPSHELPSEATEENVVKYPFDNTYNNFMTSYDHHDN